MSTQHEKQPRWRRILLSPAWEVWTVASLPFWIYDVATHPDHTASWCLCVGLTAGTIGFGLQRLRRGPGLLERLQARDEYSRHR